MFAIAIFPFVPVQVLPATLDIASLAPMLFTELLIGIVIDEHNRHLHSLIHDTIPK